MAVVYAFAGKERRADIGDKLRERVAAWNAAEIIKIELELNELDTLRGGVNHNLLERERQAGLIEQVKGGKTHVMLITPPCNTHSRALHSGMPGCWRGPTTPTPQKAA